MKNKETLEEVAERILFENTKNVEIRYRGGRDSVIKSMLDIAKWQQEQDKNKYSEEEVYNIVEQAMKDYGKNQLGFFDGGVSDPIYYNLKKWFEQFKKK
jgi:hypothetical protein